VALHRLRHVEFPDLELQRWWTNPEVIVQTRVYDELDGAQAGRPDYNSAALSSDGRVWLPAESGYRWWTVQARAKSTTRDHNHRIGHR